MGTELVNIYIKVMKKILLSVVAVAVFLFSGCTKEPVKTGEEQLSISEEILTFGIIGGELGVTVTSSEDWRVAGYADWVTPLSESGRTGDKLVFKALPNNGTETKVAEFKIFAGSAVKKLTVKSLIGEYVRLESSDESRFGSEGGALKVKVETNSADLKIEYSGDGQDWIEYRKRTDAFGFTNLEFDIAKTDKYLDRNSDIIIKADDASEGVKVNVRQERLFAVVTATPKIVKTLSEETFALVVRSNVEHEIADGFADWLTCDLSSKGEMEEDGLSTYTYSLHVNAGGTSSRITELKFMHQNTQMLSVSVKQQCENPVLIEIQDPGLRKVLNDRGWIIADSVSPECELLEIGQNAEELDFDSGSVRTVSGLSAFPKLTGLSLGGADIEVIDITDCDRISSLTIKESVRSLKEIKTGSNPVSDIIIRNDNSSFLRSDVLTVSGDNITLVQANASSFYAIWYGDEKLKTIDVTACPALTTLKAKREIYGSSVLETILVTAAQKASIDAGTLKVEKSNETNITVK